MSTINYEKHSVTQWYVRQYETDFDTLKANPESGGLNYNAKGDVTNPLVWEDPKIAEGTNFNVITDAGKQLMWNTLFALAGSGSFNSLAFGASSTAAVHTNSQLVYEHQLDPTRVALTNQSGTVMTSGSVVALSTFNDTSFTPTVSYYTSATVMGTIVGSTTLNTNQPVQEVALASTRTLPTTPTGVSGTIWNRFVLGAAVVLTNTTTLQVLIVSRA